MVDAAQPASAFERPSDAQIQQVTRLLKPWEMLTSPVYVGLDNIPDRRPLLFVGNHTTLGLLDVPLMFMALHRERGIFLRSLGHHMHFKVPAWRDFLQRFGAVDGTRENCARLMQAGECILVFPGGAREVSKRKGEKYQLLWKERVGFARLAIQNGCDIVPFAAVGAEEAYDIVLDANDLARSPLGSLLGRLGMDSDIALPLVRGLGPFPRPVRFYFAFGPTIDVSGYADRKDDRTAWFELREQASAAVRAQIDGLMAMRESDPEHDLMPRVISALQRLAEERRR